MKNNQDLQKDVRDTIQCEPFLNTAEIGVTAKDSFITLTRIVKNFSKKSEAEEAAKNVAVVKVVVEKIEVQGGSAGNITDNDIAGEIIGGSKRNWEIQGSKIKLKVGNCWVTPDDELNWNYQKDAARKIAGKLSGGTGVSENLTIKSGTSDKIEKMILNALPA